MNLMQIDCEEKLVFWQTIICIKLFYNLLFYYLYLFIFIYNSIRFIY